MTLHSKPSGQEEVRVLSKAFSETVSPDRAIAYGVDKVIELIRVDQAGDAGIN